MEPRRLLMLGGSLALNILVACLVLPFAIPPFHGYTFAQLGEVVLWQIMGTIGWPLALVGAFLSIPFGGEVAALTPLLLVLIYPAILFLLVRVAVSKVLRRWELPLLHLLLVLSFIAVWYHVLNGYDFMVG